VFPVVEIALMPDSGHGSVAVTTVVRAPAVTAMTLAPMKVSIRHGGLGVHPAVKSRRWTARPIPRFEILISYHGIRLTTFRGNL